jgi:elongation factor 2
MRNKHSECSLYENVNIRASANRGGITYNGIGLCEVGDSRFGRAKATFLEPVQNVFISIPQNLLGNVTREVQGRRGQILDIKTEGDMVSLKAETPVAEMFGFAGDIRSATEGRALWSTEFAGFKPIPQNLFGEKVMDVRKRKGMKLEMPKASDFVSS